MKHDVSVCVHVCAPLDICLYVCIVLSVYLKIFTCFNVQRTHNISQTVHSCSTSILPSSLNNGFWKETYKVRRPSYPTVSQFIGDWEMVGYEGWPHGERESPCTDLFPLRGRGRGIKRWWIKCWLRAPVLKVPMTQLFLFPVKIMSYRCFFSHLHSLRGLYWSVTLQSLSGDINANPFFSFVLRAQLCYAITFLFCWNWEYGIRYFRRSKSTFTTFAPESLLSVAQKLFAPWENSGKMIW